MKRERNIRSIIAQIILIVILIPFLAIICSAVYGSKAPSTFIHFLMASLSQIPMCGIWVDLLDQSASGLTHAGFIEMIPEVLLRSAPEALILTVSVHAANQFSRHVLKQIGLPILSTMAGIIISIALMSFAGSRKSIRQIFCRFRNIHYGGSNSLSRIF